MRDLSYKCLQGIFSLFWRCRLVDGKNITSQGPAVYVSNHLGSYGPVAVLTAFPERLYPWVDYQVADRKLCPGYLCKDFIEPELHLRGPLARVLGWLISRACVPLMKHLGAVPVKERSMGLVATWKRSLEHLKLNRSLIVFPENEESTADMILNDFDDGFVGIASIYFDQTGKVLPFVPVAVNKLRRAIRIGTPVLYDPRNGFMLERTRITSALRSRINEMYLSLDR
jgi:1-acyl-sn-glycerol-3-phosphate acyltransferase